MSRTVAFPVSFEALLRAIHAIMSLDAIAITNGTLQAVRVPKAYTGPGSRGVVPRSGTVTVHAARLARTCMKERVGVEREGEKMVKRQGSKDVKGSEWFVRK